MILIHKPKSDVQRCIIHQLRLSTRYVSYNDLKPFMADLIKKYISFDSEELALEQFMELKNKWREGISISGKNLERKLGCTINI